MKNRKWLTFRKNSEPIPELRNPLPCLRDPPTSCGSAHPPWRRTQEPGPPAPAAARAPHAGAPVLPKMQLGGTYGPHSQTSRGAAPSGHQVGGSRPCGAAPAAKVPWR